jgi:hypothetical protein
VRVVVPATPDGLHPSTLPAILRSGWAAHVEPMTYTEAYYDLLCKLWADKIDFAIVEHDVEVNPETLDRFAECDHLWCAHSYEVYAGDVSAAYGGPFALGCVRFRAELMERFPDVVVEAGKMDIHPVHPPRSYGVMDSTLTHQLRGPFGPDRGGVKVHQHAPNVGHHHAYVRAGAFRPIPQPSPSEVGSPL